MQEYLDFQCQRVVGRKSAVCQRLSQVDLDQPIVVPDHLLSRVCHI